MGSGAKIRLAFKRNKVVEAKELGKRGPDRKKRKASLRGLFGGR